MTHSLVIVVPTRNSGSIIHNLVNSLESQVYRNWRVIFVDASTSSSEISHLKSLVATDPRFSLVFQPSDSNGIYAAMNIGFKHVMHDEWVLFWGSDDWAASPFSLDNLMSIPKLSSYDLVVCRGQYISPFDNGSFAKKRMTSFFYFLTYRLSLFLGSTPPHQCTLISPSVHNRLNSYSTEYSLAADLYYFLSLPSLLDISVKISPDLLVFISTGGASDTYHSLRISEVAKIYRSFYGFLFPISFVCRYVQRLLVFVLAFFS